MEIACWVLSGIGFVFLLAGTGLFLMRVPKHYRLVGTDLANYAKKLGVYIDDVDNGHQPTILTRIDSALRSKRENWAWIVVFVSATASVVSAVAAWTAVLSKVK